MTILFCSYIFGPEWQDIKYFEKIEDALEKMKADYKKADSCWINNFPPFIVTYFSKDNEILEKDVWKVEISKNDSLYINKDESLKTKDGKPIT